MLMAQGVTRAFGRRRAVEEVSVTLARGECLALFGPNGAGKTTLLRILGGLLRPTSGQVSIDGLVLPGGPEVRAKVGLISHHTMLYEALTAHENVLFAARLYGVAHAREAAQRALEQMGADGYAHRTVRSLSRGMQQRVAIARAMVHRPSLILADEPFTGLDANGSAELSSLLADLRDGGAALVIVTHNLDEALALCTHAAIMRQGRFVRFDSAPIPEVPEYTALYKELLADSAHADVSY